MNLNNLITLCIQNDRQAQRQLYESYKDALYTIAYRIIGDFDSSNDILQETFIDAFRGLKDLKEKKYFYSWIRQILVRKAYKYLSKRKEVKEINEVDYPLVNQSNSLDVEYIERAIQKLPFKSRTVFVMAEIEGFSHKEISDAIEISIGTSKSQLNYAKTKLKEMLTEYIVD